MNTTHRGWLALSGMIVWITGSVAFGQSQEPTLPQNWQQLPLKEYAELTAQFGIAITQPSPQAGVKEIGQQLAAHAWDKFLKDGQCFDEDRTAALRLASAVMMAGGVGPPQNQALLEQVKRRVSESGVMASLRVEEVTFVYGVYRRNGVSRAEIADFAVKWVEASRQWRQCTPKHIVLLMTMLGQQTNEKTTALRGQLAGHVYARWLSDSSTEQAELADLPAMLAQVGSWLQAEQKKDLGSWMTKRIFKDNKTLGALSANQVIDLWTALGGLGATEKQRAEALATWMNASDNWKSAQPMQLGDCLWIVTRSRTGAAQKMLGPV